MQKVSRICLWTLCLIAAGCASYTQDYQQRLIDTLPYKGEVVFDDLARFPGDVLCGNFTSRNVLTNARVTAPFVVTPGEVLSKPSEAQRAVYCGRDAEGALFEHHGIGGPDADWATLERVVDDQARIEQAVFAFYNTNAVPPTRLEQLLDGDYGIRDATQLNDPWDRPYLYNPGLAGRSVPQIKLQTLGRDGQSGGAGDDADVSNEHIDEITHVLALRN